MGSEEEAARRDESSIAPLVCEFFGTFLFQFFAGCAVVGVKSLSSAALAIGFTLMVFPRTEDPFPDLVRKLPIVASRRTSDQAPSTHPPPRNYH